MLVNSLLCIFMPYNKSSEILCLIKTVKFNKRDVSMLMRLIKKNYLLTKLYYEYLYRISSFKGKEPLVVYQAGKVGSSSVVKFLESLHLDRMVFHVHSLRPQTLRKIRTAYYGDAPGCWFKKYEPRSLHLLQSCYLYRHLNRRWGGRHRYKVVSIIREPVARNISAFFQTIDLQIPDFLERYHANLLTSEQFLQIFLESFEDHEGILVWLDEELKAMLGVDVYAAPFPKTKGYQIYHGNRAGVLLIKMEMIGQCIQDAFKEFLGIENTTLPRVNVSSDKPYAKIYQDFTQSLVIPAFYLDRMYGSKYTQHFYSAEEICRFRSKWSKE